MSKFCFILFLVVLSACSSVKPVPNDVATQVNAPEVQLPAPVSSAQVPMPQLKAILKVVEFRNHTEKELKRNTLAVEKIREVVRGECFRKNWLERSLIQTGGRTNQEVLDHILSSEPEVILEMYYTWATSTNGYRYPDSNILHLNRKYHNYYGVCSAGSQIVHEVSHSIGYGHDKRPNSMRPYSVPYSINWAFELCCKD